ncbi:MAG: hypothetical protein GW880_34550, partial [Armatimonadetes bacterium]|nr:hypothetical protein [Armatimonadota bacterium]
KLIGQRLIQEGLRLLPEFLRSLSDEGGSAREPGGAQLLSHLGDLSADERLSMPLQVQAPVGSQVLRGLFRVAARPREGVGHGLVTQHFREEPISECT